MDEQRAAVVGGGNMGADVAALLAAHGWRVGVIEPDRSRWGALSARVASAARALGAPSATVHVAASGAEADWTGVALVIECAPERLELKRAIFAELERLAPAQAILGSNSSGFPISAIAAGLATAHRMLGLHFFLPAHLVPAVEVIRGAATDDAVWHRAADLMRACGKVPVMVRKDIPGFLANRIQHALMREAFALIDAGLAAPEDIDNAVRYGFGFRYVAAGPILQKELAGLDIHAAAAATIYPDLARNTAPGATLTGLVAAGKLGVKSGAGFWEWTPESARAARERYERDLADALAILERSLAAGAPAAGPVSPPRPGPASKSRAPRARRRARPPRPA